MAAMGLGNIETTGYRWDGRTAGAWGRAREASKGKDTTSGHWEIAGVRVTRAFPTFPNGFPKEFMDAYEKAIGYKCIGNKPASGTVILEELGAQHMPAATAFSRLPAMRNCSLLSSCTSSVALPGRCSRGIWASGA